MGVIAANILNDDPDPTRSFVINSNLDIHNFTELFVSLLLFGLLQSGDFIADLITIHTQRECREYNGVLVFYLGSVRALIDLHMIGSTHLNLELFTIKTSTKLALIGDLQRHRSVRIDVDLSSGIIHQRQSRLEQIGTVECTEPTHRPLPDTEVPLHQNVRKPAGKEDRLFPAIRIVITLIIQRTARTNLAEETVIRICRQTCISVTRGGRFQILHITKVGQLLDIRDHHATRPTKPVDRFSRGRITVRIDIADHVANNGCDFRLLLSPQTILEHDEQNTTFNRFQTIFNPRDVSTDVHVHCVNDALVVDIVANADFGHVRNLFAPIDVYEIVEICVRILWEFFRLTRTFPCKLVKRPAGNRP